MKAQLALGPANIQAAPGLAVGLTGVPDDLAPESCQLGDEARQFLDRDFESRPNVYRLWLVVSFSGQENGLRAVFYVKEFPSRRSIPPANDLRLFMLDSLHALPDQSRDHVRKFGVEVVAGTVKIH